MQFRKAYERHPGRTLSCGPGRTIQSAKDECDVNVIVSRFRRTGVIEHLRKHEGQYGDFLALDYHEALNAVQDAQDMFMSLPADVRKRFDNDPGQFLTFAQDAANIDTMRELGLAYRVTSEGAPVPPHSPPVDSGGGEADADNS